MYNDKESPKGSKRKGLFLILKPRQRMSYRMVVLTSGSLMLLFAGSLYVYFQFGKNEKAYAATMTAVANGNWSSPSTWSANRVPANNDSLTIPAGKTVTVDVVTSSYSNLRINVLGELYFQGGKKILMCPGIVVVGSTGLLSGANNGSKIEICNVVAWTGSNDLPGPVTVTQTGTLPVKLIYFRAKSILSGLVSLSWATASEINNDYFTIERSSNGEEFIPLETLKGAGNSNTLLSYSATDDQPFPGSAYYRLRQTDYDGKFTYSLVEYVWSAQKSIPDLVIEEMYPNPIISDQFKIKYRVSDEEIITISLKNTDGKLFAEEKIHSKKGYNEFHYQGLNKLSAGAYVICLESNQNQVSRTIVKL